MKKKTLTIIAAVIGVIALAYMCLPYYARQALLHLYPDIDDLHLFARDTVHAPDTCWRWPHAAGYNTYRLDARDAAYLDSMQTVSFLVISHDSIVYEYYAPEWCDTVTSNLYSATKTIVGLLAGIALDEGKIGSLDDPVSDYLPGYTGDGRDSVTVRDLLTMSAAIDWDESYASLLSVTTHAYYGDDLRDLVTSLGVVGETGVQYSYRSGETQLLAFVVEAAMGETLSSLAERKLWQPMGAERDAYWLLDSPGGDEKAFCCFHTTARDAARFGRLMLRHGDWDGRRLVSRRYMDEAMSPASHLKDQWGSGQLDYYGFQTWVMHYRGMVCPYMRGMLGQYVIAIPRRDAIVVRLGHKWSRDYVRELTTDIIRYMDIACGILDACQ